MLWLILGIIFCFFGGCNALQALGDRNENAALGGAVIALFFFILGIPMFVAGIKRLSCAKETASSDDLKECPFCAERIQRKAKVCRFCGKDLQQV